MTDLTAHIISTKYDRNQFFIWQLISKYLLIFKIFSICIQINKYSKNNIFKYLGIIIICHLKRVLYLHNLLFLVNTILLTSIYFWVGYNYFFWPILCYSRYLALKHNNIIILLWKPRWWNFIFKSYDKILFIWILFALYSSYIIMAILWLMYKYY